MRSPRPRHDLALALGVADEAAHEGDRDRFRNRAHCQTALGLAAVLGRPRPGADLLQGVEVAWATLIGLELRIDLVRMSLIPASSMMTRTAPPAMTPVPLEAGRRTTTPASASPRDQWGMVVSARVPGPDASWRSRRPWRWPRALRGPCPCRCRLAAVVADRDQGREAQVLAALDDLGDAADVDDLVLELADIVDGHPAPGPSLRPCP